MPHANRVTPFGELIATPAHGTLTGNRGILHDDQGRIVKHHTHLAWIACLLDFKGRRRKVMSPGTWTELFFLDEATALAAGHRPCGYCRRADYVSFKEAWAAVRGLDAGRLKVGDIDRVLHRERIAGRGANRRKPTFTTTFGSIPDGVMFHLPEARQVALLKGKGRAWAWAPEGYREGQRMDQGQQVEVLIPRRRSWT